MGSVETKPTHSTIVTIFKPERLTLQIDVTRPIRTQLNQMLHWSLSQIRRVYESFQRRTDYPFLDANMFCRIMPFSRITNFYLFEQFRFGEKYVSIFDLIAALTMTAYTSYANKMRFMYVLFDFDNSGTITVMEMMFIYEAVIQAYCKITGHKPPPYDMLERYTNILFLKTESSKDRDVILKEQILVSEIEGNEKAITMFKRFEPEKLVGIKEEFGVFLKFKPYDESTVTRMYGQLKRAALEKNYLEAEMQDLKRQIRLGTKRGDDLTSAEDEANKFINQYLHVSGIAKRNSVLVRSPSINKKRLPSLQKLPAIRPAEVSAQLLSRRRAHSHAKLIFIKGETLSRQQVFTMYEYFNALSNNNQSIKVRQFFEAFEGKPCMHKLVSSLYNYLDSDQKGQVTFHEFLYKLYPSLKKEDIQLVDKWVDQYRRTFDTNYFHREEETEVKSAKKVLPASSLKRLKEIFEALDADHKGYLVFDDFKKSFKLGYTITEVEQIFQKYDKDGTKRLYIYDFAQILLPDNFTIQGLEQLKR